MSAVRGSSFACGSARLTVAAPARAVRRAAPAARAMADGPEGEKKTTLWAEARALACGTLASTGATRRDALPSRHARAHCFSGVPGRLSPAWPLG